jgi:hypothetical protein
VVGSACVIPWMGRRKSGGGVGHVAVAIGAEQVEQMVREFVISSIFW